MASAPKAPKASAPKAEPTSKVSTSVQYINPDIGLTTRVFDLDTHGEDFDAIAHEFAAGKNGVVDIGTDTEKSYDAEEKPSK